jgi:hypothetical protein
MAAGHLTSGALGVELLLEESGMVGPGETLGSSWPHLAIRLSGYPTKPGLVDLRRRRLSSRRKRSTKFDGDEEPKIQVKSASLDDGPKGVRRERRRMDRGGRGFPEVSIGPLHAQPFHALRVPSRETALRPFQDGRLQGGRRAAAIFYPLRHPTPCASDYEWGNEK